MTATIGNDEMAQFESSIRSHGISPELVLVDPELRELARAALSREAEEQAALRRELARAALSREAEEQAALRAVTVEVEPQREQPAVAPLYYALDPPRPVVTARPSERRREAMAAPPSRILSLTAPSILSVSLLFNLMLAGVLLGGNGGAPTLVSPEPAAIVASTTHVQNASVSAFTPSTSTRASQRRPARPPRKQTSRASANRIKATAERTVLALVQTAPRSRIGQLIDPTSGLLKNNVQSVCRRGSPRGPAHFLCVVRSPGAARGAGLYLRYNVAANGRWSVTWLGYRTGHAHR
jgi:hypothetical protein